MVTSVVMSRKEFLLQQERRLIDELDVLADQTDANTFRYKKQRLDSVLSELEQVRTVEWKEREHAMAKELLDKEIKLKEKEIQLRNMEIQLKNKELELKNIAVETKQLEMNIAMLNSIASI